MIRILDKETLTNGIKHLKEVDEDLLLILEQNNDSINLFQRQKGFIGLINLIIEQQLSVASAKAIFGRVQQKIVPFNAHNFYKLSENKLRNAGLSKQKIEYCKGIARAVINKGFEHIKVSLIITIIIYLCKSFVTVLSPANSQQ